MTLPWVCLAIWLKYKLFHVCLGYSFINAIWWIICVTVSENGSDKWNWVHVCFVSNTENSILHHKHNYDWLLITEWSSVFLWSQGHLFNFEESILKSERLKIVTSKSCNVLWDNLIHFLIFTDEEYNFCFWKLNTISSMNGLTNG